MLVINARNVNDAYHLGMELVQRDGELIDTRNGPAYKVPRPVTTAYRCPMERVLFNDKRDANPFFHFFESLWMLAGRNDVAFLTQFVGRMSDFSDDGQTFNAAYGFRWRAHFEQDQILEAIKLLKKDPGTRRCVIGMWDPSFDLGLNSKDIPCNLAVKLAIIKGKLEIFVFNRSNDIIWGCYGANMVHMSFLQEYVAGHLGVGVGTYYQVSADYHAYQGVFDDKILGICDEPKDYYDRIEPYPIGDISGGDFDSDLHDMFNGKTAGFVSPFFTDVAGPMLDLFFTWKRDRSNKTAILSKNGWILASDWAVGCKEWLERRVKS